MAELARFEEWPSVEEAAERLQTSVRTIWRYAKEGAIQTRKRPREGKKPEVVCNPQDIQRLMPSEVHVMSAESQALTLKRRSKPDAHPWEGALEQIATILTRQNDKVSIGTKLWLSLDEAAEYSGLARSTLADLCKDEVVRAIKSGGWKILRESLEAFEG